MKIKEIKEMLDNGIQPVMRCTGDFGGYLDFDACVIENGMIVKITGYRRFEAEEEDEEVYKFCFDLSIEREHNIKLMSNDWFYTNTPLGVVKLGNPIETGWLKDMTANEYYVNINDDQEFPFELMGNSKKHPWVAYQEFKASNPDEKLSYMQWLEKEWDSHERMIEVMNWPG